MSEITQRIYAAIKAQVIPDNSIVHRSQFVENAVILRILSIVGDIIKEEE